MRASTVMRCAQAFSKRLTLLVAASAEANPTAVASAKDSDLVGASQVDIFIGAILCEDSGDTRVALVAQEVATRATFRGVVGGAPPLRAFEGSVIMPTAEGVGVGGGAAGAKAASEPP